MSGRDGGPWRRRLERLAREFAKFGAVGGVGLLVDLGVFNLLCHFMDVPVVPGGIIATVVAIGFNYLGFRYFTYRERDKNRRSRELSLFLLFSAIGLVIQSGVLYVATSGFGWDSPLQSNAFKFLGIGIATVFRFWSYRTWVFQKLPPHGAGESPEPFPADPRMINGTHGTHRAPGVHSAPGDRVT
ncbi:GtrA family protein [Streptomyces albidochromogenes]|uniref:GtrA family protein n=1 Tax=Streptomyces albidochromogenes TaxID=329524 RepID=UPI00110FD1E8|nr:GtrA family protein [Streptomyces albidochromogenes]